MGLTVLSPRKVLHSKKDVYATYNFHENRLTKSKVVFKTLFGRCKIGKYLYIHTWLGFNVRKFCSKDHFCSLPSKQIFLHLSFANFWSVDVIPE